ncbi:MAG: RNA polymerase-binding protein DksA [Gammaproteobacteria bacterium]
MAKKKSSKKVAKKKAVKKKTAAKKKLKKVATKARKKSTATTGKRRKARRRSHGNDVDIHGIKPYRTRAGEGYMNEEQMEHFREILFAWKVELMQEVDRTVHHMQDEASNFPDPNDRATQESEFGLELRTRDRERKLLKKIDQALARIDDGAYGFCEETGEEIGLKRLEARPVATLCVEAQERREVAERQFRDSDDRYR